MPARLSRYRLLLLCAPLLALPFTACGNAYRSPPPQPPPDLTVLYGVGVDQQSLYTLNTRLGVHSTVGSPGPGRLEVPAAMAIRPRDGEVFIYNNGGESGFRRQWGLVQLDRCTGFARRIGPGSLPRRAMGALAFAEDGRLYGVGQAHADDDGFHVLYRIDPDNGDYTAIGPVQRSASYSVAAADFHPDGDLYAVGTLRDTDDGELQLLLIIDTSSGAPSVVGEISPGIGVITSIVFEPSGKLLGTGTTVTGGKILLELDAASAAVSQVRSATVAAQGLGFAPPISCQATVQTIPAAQVSGPR